MKKTLLILSTGICLTACSKKESDELPTVIAAPFEEEFSLRYAQKAALDNVSAPELTLKVENIEYWATPDGVICCFGPCASIKATVRAADAQGKEQVLALTAWRGGWSQNWLDTLQVQANGKRYRVYLKALEPGLEDKKTKNVDRSLRLVVSRPAVYANKPTVTP